MSDRKMPTFNFSPFSTLFSCWLRILFFLMYHFNMKYDWALSYIISIFVFDAVCRYRSRKCVFSHIVCKIGSMEPIPLRYISSFRFSFSGNDLIFLMIKMNRKKKHQTTTISSSESYSFPFLTVICDGNENFAFMKWKLNQLIIRGKLYPYFAIYILSKFYVPNLFSFFYYIFWQIKVNVLKLMNGWLDFTGSLFLFSFLCFWRVHNV